MRELTVYEVEDISGAGPIQDFLTKGASDIGGMIGNILGSGILESLGADNVSALGKDIGSVLGHTAGAVIEGGVSAFFKELGIDVGW
ncbi:hypothetical protein [Enterobacillus tribolii]|uniref:Uncharacterized protein n=1 Tax=Enterobacillus tribolii TaxID=1487935 RepID=A0A370R2B9_9GAMM|nr:hypothetical protein [Enterobacillus tribolii]MBW7984843.1 hypothetical protein [Enterobacillus tribolii]RDK96035.1 hypothetical protein C8D90_102522 [Enterobacillus tribolii]